MVEAVVLCGRLSGEMRWVTIIVPCGSVEKLAVRVFAKEAVMCAHEEAQAVRSMPIRAAAYRYQIVASDFTCGPRPRYPFLRLGEV